MGNEQNYLGAPDEDDVIIGRYSLFRYFRDLAVVAAPVLSTDLEGIQDVNIGAKSYKQSYELIQYGGGDTILTKRANGEYSGTLHVLAGELTTIMAGLLGETFSATGNAGMPLTFPFYPIVHIEAVLRKMDNYTHIQSLVLQDLIFDPAPFPLNDNPNVVQLHFRSSHDAIIIANGCKVVFDKWTGNGSTTDFTPSATPLTVTDATMEGREGWDFNKAIFVKKKPATDTTGTRLRDGVTITPATPVLSFDTAPEEGSEVSMLYVAEISG